MHFNYRLLMSLVVVLSTFMINDYFLGPTRSSSLELTIVSESYHQNIMIIYIH
jgi:hypothetical protein